MGIQRRILLIVLVFNAICGSYFLGDCKVVVKKFENCDDNEGYKVRIKFAYKTVGDKQYANGTIVITAPVDNSLKANVSIEMLMSKTYVYLFSFNERKACEALNKYFGEMWYDMERHAGIIPELCPIAQGKYHLHNFVMAWDKMPTLQSFPFGNLRVLFMIYDSINTIFTCFVLEVTNKI